VKTILRTAFLAAVGLVAAGGCKQADRAVSAPPSHAELPTFEELGHRLPIVVGVEGASRVPRVVIVPQYEPIALTPEEREALGEKELPVPDVLLFYRPPRGPEHGVSSESFQALIGIGGVGGALVGHDAVYPRVGIHGFAGHHAYLDTLARSGAAVDGLRPPTAEVGRAWAVEVGEGHRREGAEQAPDAGR
jgi:hypothetical protein